MAQKSKVISFSPNTGSFDWDGKKFYNHVVVFENGQSGKCTTTTADGSPWKAGEEVEFNVGQDKQGNPKITRVAQAGGGWGGGKGGYKKEDEGIKAASIALGYAKDLAVDKIIPLADVLIKAEEFFVWVSSKKTKEE